MNTTSETTPPSAPQIEKSVLSCLMQSEYLDTEDTLTEDHFFSGTNRELFKLFKNSPRPLDLVEISTELQKSEKLRSLGGAGYLAEIYTFSPSSQYFKKHVKALHEYKARRHAMFSAYKLIEKSADLNDENGYIEAAGSPMTEVSNISSCAQVAKDKKQLLKELTQDIEDTISGSKSPMGYETGLRELDEAFLGLHTKRLYIISGYPTSGKTVLAIQICYHMAKSQNIPTLVISLEMPDLSIAKRNLIISSGLPALAISNPKEFAQMENGDSRLNKGQLLKIQDGLKSLRDSPIYYEDPTGAKVDQICATIRRRVRKDKVKVIAIDYLQLLKGNASSFSKENEMAEISHTFQALAKELDVVIILLSQQNKEGGTKYAAAIEEDADGIASIIQDRRDEDEKGNINEDRGKHLGIGIKKDRHNGNTGLFLPVVLNKEKLIFETQI